MFLYFHVLMPQLTCNLAIYDKSHVTGRHSSLCIQSHSYSKNHCIVKFALFIVVVYYLKKKKKKFPLVTLPLCSRVPLFVF